MVDASEAFQLAFSLIFALDGDLLENRRSLVIVSFAALIVSCCLGFAIGAVLAVFDFPGRGALVILFNALMACPPVVVGLCVYLMLSNSGPFGWLQLLYTPTAMIIAQTVLITPMLQRCHVRYC